MEDNLAFNATFSDPQPEARYIIFSPYRCKVFLPNGEWALLGRCGGLDVLRGTGIYHATNATQASLIVGNFCECSTSFTLLTGGEHFNENVVNSAFKFFPLTEVMPQGKGEKAGFSYSRGPINIGSNVIISHGATILSNVKIGNGAVIGAESVVTKDVPPYAIVAGNPARVIRYRVEEKYIDDLLRIAWWNWATTFLAQHLNAIRGLNAKEFIEYCKPLEPFAPVYEDGLLIFRMDRGYRGRSLHFLGAELNGKMIPMHQLPVQFMEYIGQLNAPAGTTATIHPYLFSFLESVGS